MAEFPELNEAPYDKVTKLDEEWLKSPEGKERWRKFITTYVPPCYYFGTQCHASPASGSRYRLRVPELFDLSSHERGGQY